MRKVLTINRIIKPFNKKIYIEGDKSLSIRWVLLSSLSRNKSISYNLLKSDDVMSAISCIKKLGSRVKVKDNKCEIIGSGLNYKIKKNLILDAGNSGTLGRLILGLLVNADKKFKLVGDKSLSKRDFGRVTKPLKKFGASFKLNKNRLPLMMKGVQKPKPINFYEKKGSAQSKTSVIFAALKSEGTTRIKAKKSRDHTEILLKHLKIPINIKKTKNLDYISIKGVKKINSLKYRIPGDMSSSAFFIVLTILSKRSQILIKNVNVNPSRIGVINILKKMGANIKFINTRKYRGEMIADVFAKSSENLKGVTCPRNLNSSAIDEFLLIFLIAARSQGVSRFNDISELNQKESERLNWGSKILSLMGIKNKKTKDSIKIYGNPKLQIQKTIHIKNFLKDHRVFMMSVIAALTFGGKWKINDPDSIKTSFPSFLKTLKFIEQKKY